MPPQQLFMVRDLITTRGGFEGKGKVTYNTYYGVKKITKTLDVLDPYEYVYWQYELQNTVSSFEKYFGDFNDFDLYKQMKGTDWQKEIFGRTGTSMYHNLSVAGGSKVTKYNISLTQNNEEEIMMGSGYARTNFTVKTFHKVNEWLTIDMNVRLSDDQLKGAGTSNNARLTHAVQFRPVNGLMDFVDSDMTDVADFEILSSYILNPKKQTEDDYQRRKSQTYNFSGATNIKMSKYLSYSFNYGIQYGENVDKHYYGVNTSNALQYGEQPLASIINRKSKSYNLANILTYSRKDFSPGSSITAMLGEELIYNKSEVINSSAKYFPKNIDAVSALSMMQLGIADPINTADNSANKISSFFGRLNYDYKRKYLATVTFRADGSSKFAPGNQWGYFPSAALAWRISDEPFLSGTRKWLNDLKIRTSYGESGNNRISDNAWQKTFTVTSNRIFMEGNETTPTSYIVPNRVLSNPELKWETTVSRNVGVDFGLFKQRLSGSVELYKNTTKDLLISTTIPSSSGYSTQWQNIGQTSNRGLEFNINGILVEQKDFRFHVTFNIGFNKNRIDELGEIKEWGQSAAWSPWDGGSSDYLVKEGESVGLMYGYETDGMYSFDDFDYENGTYVLKEGVANSKAVTGARRFWPGSLKLKDQNGDFIIDAANDKVVIGDANPKHTGGVNFMAQYKGFDFSAFFNWVYGNDIYNANKLVFTTSAEGRIYKNLLNMMNSENRFIYIDKMTGKEISDPVQLAEMNKNATIWSAGMDYIPRHSWGIEDGSFLRLNNLTIGYSIDKNLSNKLKVDNIRIYATAYNLWTWTKYSGYDPEVDTRRNTPLTPGVDWCAYPRSRSFIIGLNLEF